ncbi:MAG: hypothetical protein ACFFCM_16465 [Promethearchaeota archaeon]
MNYHEFLLFAARRLKLKFEIVKFIIQGFLNKYQLTQRTIECYLLWGQKKNYSIIGKQLKISISTVCRELQKLEFVCPELFVECVSIPDIPQMYFPDKSEWEEIERLNQIKEKF